MRSFEIPCWSIWSVIAVIALSIFDSAIRAIWYAEASNNDEAGIAYGFALAVDLIKLMTSAVGALTSEFQ